jgi:hypothetical protein
MALRLIYQMFAKLLGWIVLRTRADATKDIEILVLRHQLAVLQRRTPRPRITWTDRALIAALTRLLPVRRRLGLLVTPATILRWHRQLVTNRWTTQHARPGHPAIPAGLRRLASGPRCSQSSSRPGEVERGQNAPHRPHFTRPGPPVDHARGRQSGGTSDWNGDSADLSCSRSGLLRLTPVSHSGMQSPVGRARNRHCGGGTAGPGPTG